MNTSYLATHSLGKKFLAIVVISAVGGIIGWWKAASQAPSYSGTIGVEITNSTGNPAGSYNYDGYYSILTSGNLFDTVASIAATPNTVAKVYQAADISLPTSNIKDIAKLFSAKRFSATATGGYIEVDNLKTADSARKLLTSLSNELKSDIAAMKAQNQIPPQVNIVVSEPSVFTQKPDVMMTMLVATLLGLILAAMVIVVQAALKD